MLAATYYLENLCTLGNYDLKRRGFNCEVDDQPTQGIYLRMIGEELFLKGVTYELSFQGSGPYGDKLYARSLLLRTDQETGIRIENATEKKVYAIFKIEGVQPFYESLKSLGIDENKRIDTLAAADVRILAAADGRILYDKAYPAGGGAKGAKRK